jgi:16S rRNA C1402 (ribose-2'-O) methylase RsmI
MRNAALAYLVKTSVGPATEFELRWQQTTERARTLATEMDRHTSAEMDRHVKDLPEPHQG